MAYRYVFGPVMSGRLGRSLGLDLLGGHICSMDCVYCEVGATRNLTLERRPYVSAAAILKELAAWKAEGLDTPDAVTLGGLGEPTLNSDMAEIIAGARALFPDTVIAVLTNATLMTDPQVRRELALADAVLPSMDSLVEAEFAAINRPCPGVTPQGVAQGLLAFRQEFTGKIFLEILLAKGINDSDENLGRLKTFCQQLAPDRVDVVTMTRPGTVKGTHPVDGAVLSRWRKALGAGKARTGERGEPEAGTLDEARTIEFVQASLARRPQTVLQLAQALGASPHTVRAAVEALERTGGIVARTDRGETYYHGSGHILEA
ncbi:MAG: radical SAM protein [Pseudodesulfovibrio sp.]|uniref:Radical SAM domain protein n=1 Tax=Pseudodesulfovibrio aespoeensis (strain ATCC 700646 / DSM 10631 / Aspo-2) TaxID=643562 RepID=E6VV51_PSEA9|nr:MULTISPECIES: radical SAM protein [Pseudodesulfovibrio]MBU4191469.1 radical SAM protein [Pseudomonadota bacterium]ADU61202.1 Radical SAM domain protein [Pseudodesulfovibrio aespoeensis Aspo-2]MBU4245284.1 radical SAM protein [Pseudomonadota bacterium]MBU4379234.1 radical SAM protein [Pseudomonadota bacterium]MBU4476652.1 radical SAM protein [Pseudomonadota bacterium]